MCATVNENVGRTWKAAYGQRVLFQAQGHVEQVFEALPEHG